METTTEVPIPESFNEPRDSISNNLKFILNANHF